MNRRRVSISGFLLSFFPLLYEFFPERCRSVRKGANVAVPCVGVFFMAKLCGRFYVFTNRSAYLTPSGDHIFLFYVFTDLSANPTTSGGSIFLLVKKDRGERHAKGLQSRPLETCFYTGDRRGDVPSFLRVRPTAIDAIKSAAALRLFPCLSVLHRLRRKRWH